MGLIRLGGGAIGMADCDVFGRMRPEIFIGRVSDGVPALGAALRAPEDGRPADRPSGVGGAVLEYRVAYLGWPRAGGRFEIRSGLAAVGDRTQNLVHWMLDPESGRAWGTAEAVAISLDLDARKVIPISPKDQIRLRARVVPGLTF
jgi:acyl-CoA thioester hydrolase